MINQELVHLIRLKVYYFIAGSRRARVRVLLVTPLIYTYPVFRC